MGFGTRWKAFGSGNRAAQTPSASWRTTGWCLAWKGGQPNAASKDTIYGTQIFHGSSYTVQVRVIGYMCALFWKSNLGVVTCTKWLLWTSEGLQVCWHPNAQQKIYKDHKAGEKCWRNAEMVCRQSSQKQCAVVRFEGFLSAWPWKSRHQSVSTDLHNKKQRSGSPHLLLMSHSKKKLSLKWSWIWMCFTRR